MGEAIIRQSPGKNTNCSYIYEKQLCLTWEKRTANKNDTGAAISICQAGKERGSPWMGWRHLMFIMYTEVYALLNFVPGAYFAF